MKLIVYRQSSKTRPDGTVVYKGEDALPYVDDQVFFVADGLGGASAIRHQKFLPELFDKDKIMDALFEGVYKDYSNETFVKYVTDSFYELFAVKDCYTENINNIKKSGYFASRIVTAIVLHEMLYNKECSGAKIFERLSACETEEARDALTAALGRHFKEIIKTKIREISKKANLVYESSYLGLALLGSTVCATIYYESADKVDAFYLTAGDSRPYVWTENGGLCQILADEEGADGGMTNYIKANDDADFNIRCNHFSFNKPCVLFNASDGCFDSGRFVSQMAFEKLILESVVASDDVDGVSASLTSFFAENGRHDDSSTIAMRIFGYDGYDAFKKSCTNRLNTMSIEYFSKMEDLLDADYIGAYQDSGRALLNKLAVLKDKFASEQFVMDYCAEYVRSEKYAPFVQRKNSIETDTYPESENISIAKRAIIDTIKSNYVKFGNIVSIDDAMLERYGISRTDGFKQQYDEIARAYLARVEKYKSELSAASAALGEVLDGIYAQGIPTAPVALDSALMHAADECGRFYTDLFKFLSDIKSGNLEDVRAIVEIKNAYAAKNVEMAEANPGNVATIFNMILHKDIRIDSIDMPDSEKQIINYQMQVMTDSVRAINAAKKQRIEQAFSESVSAYWNNGYADIIRSIMTSHPDRISPALAAEASAIIREIDEQLGSTKAKCELQKALFDKYDDKYNLYIGANV